MEHCMSIKTAVLDGVATIEIARPEKKNALTQAMYTAMAEALAAAREDKAVRSILITGQPGVFTSGNDIEDFMQRPPGQGSDAMDSPVFRFMQALLACDKPVVAAVTGAAIGIGTTMLLHCDLVYVSDEARLAMPFVSLGLVPEFASSLLVPQLMGNRRAAEKLLLGDPFTGEQAVECGIANAVLPASEVLPHARRVAERFNALPPGAVRQAKQLMRAPQQEQVLQVIRTEGAQFAQRLRSPEAMEAFQAFFQKRQPDFSRFA
jgi:enoyl-CoA hydratase/carnithine racemase